MEKKLRKAFVLRCLTIALGCLSLGAGIALFLDPNRIAPGGVSGIAIILSRFVPLDTGLIMLILNVPLLAAGAAAFGKRFLFSTVYATILLSLFTDLLSFILKKSGVIAITDDLFLAAIFGGILAAVGLGLVFRCGSTTGGMDIAVKLIRKKFRHLGTGIIFFATDFAIAGISAAVFKDIEIGLYACVGILVYSLLLDTVICGGYGAKFVYIVSASPQRIKQRILSELGIGATDLEGAGGFTGEKKKIVLAAVKKHLYPKLRDIVREEDASAFMIVSSAQEVYGLGFRSHHEEP